jgi:hypothetical protein
MRRSRKRGRKGRRKRRGRRIRTHSVKLKSALE